MHNGFGTNHTANTAAQRSRLKVASLHKLLPPPVLNCTHAGLVHHDPLQHALGHILSLNGIGHLLQLCTDAVLIFPIAHLLMRTRVCPHDEPISGPAAVRIPPCFHNRLHNCPRNSDLTTLTPSSLNNSIAFSSSSVSVTRKVVFVSGW